MLRVLSIIHHTEFSGPTNRNIKVIPLLEKEQIETFVLIPDRPIASAYDRLNKGGIKVLTENFHRLRASTNLSVQKDFFLNFFPDIRRIRKIIRRNKIDIVQLNGFMNPHGAIAGWLEKKKVVWQLIDTRSPKLLMLIIMPMVIFFSNAVMCTGRKTAKAHPFVRYIKKKIQYFYPPVDIEIFKIDHSERKAARRSLGLGEADLIIGTVGTINPQKGHETFIEAAASLIQKIPAAKFIILGSVLNTQRKYAQAIEKYAVEKGLIFDTNFLILNPDNRVQFYLRALDVFWMTSVPRSEGISTAVEEAMATGIPVVSTDVGSMSEIVLHGKTGYVVPPYDSTAIAQYTLKIIENPLQAEGFSKLARKQAFRHFSAQNCAERHSTCYRKILK